MLPSVSVALGLLSAGIAFAHPSASAAESGSGTPHSHPHNLNNPHRRALKRSITTDAASINGESFDFVIAGGGVAGLTLAARLSEWSNVTVLCIEAGGDGTDVEDQIDIPGYSYLHSLTGSAYDWAYHTTVQSDSGNVTKYWPRGKGLGGSGAINGMFFGRASSEEYDAWATLNPDGAETWNWAEVDKYIMKAENYSHPNASVVEQFGMVLNESAHGDSGPLQIGYSEYIFDEVAKWIPAWETLGFTSKDLSGGSTHGVALSTSTINMKNQSRSDSKAAYIDPLPPRSNLVILTKQQVTQVIFNGTTDSSGNLVASGVKFQANSSESSYSVQANKEVILCGGTVGTPQLLQLSGVGPKDTLTALGITSKLDLPVGYNLQDHISYSMYWSTPQGTFTWNNLSSSSDLQTTELTEYNSDKTGMWTYINEAVGYPSFTDIATSSVASTYASSVSSDLDTTVSDVTSWFDLPTTVATGLKAQYQLQQEWLTTDVGQLEIILTMLGKGNNEMGIQVALQHPWSRGTIFINSTDPFSSPLINPGYFGVGYDIDIIGYGSVFARSVAAASPLSEVMITETYPGATYTGDALANYTKENAGTEYHPLGTCAMLPQASGGVVDTTLTVYGSANLRVIDTSIIPMHISAHTMATTYGVAEKGADIIKKKHWAAVTTTTTNSTDSSSTASAGKATDTAVTNANNDAASASSTLSTGAKAGIAAGAAVGAIAVLGALIFFCCIKRRKNKQAQGEKGWYNGASRADPYDGGLGGGEYKAADPGPAYPMAAFDTYGNGQSGDAPNAPWIHSRSHSVDTMATTELASHTPMRSGSNYGLSAGANSPYRDGDSDDGHGNGMGQGYNQAPYGGGAPVGGYGSQQQRYHPVELR